MSVSLVILGAGATVIGLVLLLLPSAPASIAWFAYQPLSTTTFAPPGAVLTPQNQIGIVLLTVGLVVLAFGAGWALGQRRAPSQRRSTEPDSPGN